VVHALNHVADDFAWCVPDAEFLAELRVEGFEERLVKVVDGFVLIKSVEERRLDAVECVTGMIEDLDDLDGVESSALGDCVKEGSKDGNA